MNKLVKKMTAAVMTLALAVTAISAQAFAVEPEQYELDQIAKNSIGLDYNENNESISGSLVSVNRFSGNVAFKLSGIPGRIVYNSQQDDDVGFGPAFTANAFQTMTAREDGSYVYKNATGSLSHFYPVPGSNECRDELGWNLSRPGNAFYVYYNSNLRPAYDFNENGKVTSFQTRAMSGSYYPQYRVSHHADGRVMLENSYEYESWTVSDQIIFAYDADNKISYITNMSGAKYEFVYNAQGNLQAVKNAGGTIILDLDYDDTGKLITRIGSTQIQYDDQGRAVLVKAYSSNGLLTANTTFAYGDGRTTVNKIDGTSKVYQFDPMGNQM